MDHQRSDWFRSWPRSPQRGKSELCHNVSHDWCIWLPAFFSYLFSQPFLTGVFWCHLTTCKDKGIEWRLLNVNHSLVVLIPLFFMLCWQCQHIKLIILPQCFMPRSTTACKILVNNMHFHLILKSANFNFLNRLTFHKLPFFLPLSL